MTDVPVPPLDLEAPQDLEGRLKAELIRYLQAQGGQCQHFYPPHLAAWLAKVPWIAALRDARQRVQELQATVDDIGLDYDHSREERKRLEAALAAAERESRLREAMGSPTSIEFPGVLPALWWALDLLDKYDAEMLRRGDPPALVNSEPHVTAKRLAREFLEKARASLSPTPPEAHRE